jgi:hypothetical protein
VSVVVSRGQVPGSAALVPVDADRHIRRGRGRDATSTNPHPRPRSRHRRLTEPAASCRARVHKECTRLGGHGRYWSRPDGHHGTPLQVTAFWTDSVVLDGHHLPGFYPRLALGEIDFWVNGWFPNHEPVLDEELPDGSAVRDHVLAIGTEIAGGGLQGVVVDTATAEAASITWFGDIGDSPETAALFDVDGNGLADLVGCDAGWGCQAALDDLIEQNGWADTIEQMSGSYDKLWADAVARFDAGEPVLAYAWTPSGYLGEITPGGGAQWLSLLLSKVMSIRRRTRPPFQRVSRTAVQSRFYCCRHPGRCKPRVLGRQSGACPAVRRRRIPAERHRDPELPDAPRGRHTR